VDSDVSVTSAAPLGPAAGGSRWRGWRRWVSLERLRQVVARRALDGAMIAAVLVAEQRLRRMSARRPAPGAR
jgi:hypothetical protein